ncbi:MAG: hypothetical protein DMG17_21665 [Acidobacteria bacterium]|nr:MAG: hypothetical protein DMG17_21665 [Acidobacteriota bacterium]
MFLAHPPLPWCLFQFAFRSDPSRKFRFISRNFRGAETKLGTGQVQSKLFVVQNSRSMVLL